MRIRRLVATDARVYWHTRNRGLKEFPDAFTTSYEEGFATSPETLAKRFGGPSSDNLMVGAFAEGDVLAGHAGFQRETRAKNRHMGTLIGMYVTPEFRGQRVGSALLDHLIGEIRRLDGMEQVNLTVTHSNESARALYLRAGFVTFGLERNALKVGEHYVDKEHMVLML
ncbi:MAG: GNAT family N-acetyltransferase [Betaproteobacteria bacterium]